jgi:hypothetical protein
VEKQGLSTERLSAWNVRMLVSECEKSVMRSAASLRARGKRNQRGEGQEVGDAVDLEAQRTAVMAEVRRGREVYDAALHARRRRESVLKGLCRERQALSVVGGGSAGGSSDGGEARCRRIEELREELEAEENGYERAIGDGLSYHFVMDRLCGYVQEERMLLRGLEANLAAVAGQVEQARMQQRELEAAAGDESRLLWARKQILELERGGREMHKMQRVHSNSKAQQSTNARAAASAQRRAGVLARCRVQDRELLRKARSAKIERQAATALQETYEDKLSRLSAFTGGKGVQAIVARYFQCKVQVQDARAEARAVESKLLSCKNEQDALMNEMAELLCNDTHRVSADGVQGRAQRAARDTHGSEEEEEEEGERKGEEDGRGRGEVEVDARRGMPIGMGAGFVATGSATKESIVSGLAGAGGPVGEEMEALKASEMLDQRWTSGWRWLDCVGDGLLHTQEDAGERQHQALTQASLPLERQHAASPALQQCSPRDFVGVLTPLRRWLAAVSPAASSRAEIDDASTMTPRHQSSLPRPRCWLVAPPLQRPLCDDLELHVFPKLYCLLCDMMHILIARLLGFALVSSWLSQCTLAQRCTQANGGRGRPGERNRFRPGERNRALDAIQRHFGPEICHVLQSPLGLSCDVCMHVCADVCVFACAFVCVSV